MSEEKAFALLSPDRLSALLPLIEPLDHTLALRSFIAGLTPGEAYVDNPDSPECALFALGWRVYLAGPFHPELASPLHRLITETVIPRSRSAGRDAILLWLGDPAWESALEVILAGLYPLARMYQYYECVAPLAGPTPPLPEGMRQAEVSAELVGRDDLEHIEVLRDELCSERPTVEDFLARSFGVCILDGSRLAAWCLSEYNLGERCEVGVATMREYQRRGLGTITSRLLVNEAFLRGYQRIGWHCWASNLASSALALRAGFVFGHEQPAFICAFGLGPQFAMHGYENLNAGDPSAALQWFERGLAEPDAPTWAWYETARCLARLGRPDAARARLRQAVERGFQVPETARGDPEMAPLLD